MKDASNIFLVSGQAGNYPWSRIGLLSILRPPAPARNLGKDEVLNLIAWLAVVSGVTREEVNAAIEEVESL